MRKFHAAGDETRERNHVGIQGQHSRAKERQLITEAMTVRRAEVAGEVPPLGLEFRMVFVISWKLIVPPRQRQAPISLKVAGEQTQSNQQTHQLPATTTFTLLVLLSSALMFQKITPPLKRDPTDFSTCSWRAISLEGHPCEFKRSKAMPGQTGTPRGFA